MAGMELQEVVGVGAGVAIGQTDKGYTEAGIDPTAPIPYVEHSEYFPGHEITHPQLPTGSAGCSCNIRNAGHQHPSWDGEG